MERHRYHRGANADRRRSAEKESPRRLRPRPRLVEGARLMRAPPLATILLASAALGACATTYKPPIISYDNSPRKAVLTPDPPKPVQIVELPKLLPLPGQLKPIPGREDRAAGAGRPTCARRSGQWRGAGRADASRLSERHPGLSLVRRRWLSGLCRARRDHRHSAGTRRAACRFRPGRRRRHRALDHWRY